MTSLDDFVWTFPLYLVANNFTVDPTIGDAVFDENIRFGLAESPIPNGPKAVAVFTDGDLAEQHRNQLKLDCKMELLTLATPATFHAFLLRAQSGYLAVVIDPDRKSSVWQAFEISSLLPVIERLTRP